MGAEAPDATVLADLEFLHRAPGFDLPDTGERLEDGDDLELGDSVVGVALRQQLAEADRSSLQLLLQFGPLATGGSCLLERRLALLGIKLRREGHSLGTSGGDNETLFGPRADTCTMASPPGPRRTRSV
jgi:hypothetical protein